MVAVCVDSSREVEREKENKSITEGTMKRRVSARIQATKQQRAEKEELVRKRVELLDENGERNKKRANVFSRRRVNVDDVNEEHKHEHEHEHEHQDEHEEVMVVKEKEKEMQVSSTEALKSQVANVNEKIAGVVTEKSVNARVKETLRLFNKHYLHFVQEEETRCQKEQVDKKAAKNSKSKKKNAVEIDTKKKAKRPDLKAISKMIETNAIMYPEKKIGDLPGIDVGHQFYSRAEMVAIGFHSHWLNGIDYMGLSYSKEYRDYTFPIAIAIVLSGMYEDDLDNAEDVIYTGQGGHDLTGNKRQIRDQVMERGNLALKNCVEQSMPVRVVRGHESTSSYSGKVYTYDGLYKVVQYWAEKGISGFTVYKYRLRRLEGQPTLTTNQVHFVYGRVPQSISEIRGLVCEDISRGQEVVPIPATNLVDDPPVPPTGFTYRKALQVSKNIKLPTNAVGCDCKGACLDPRTCACAKLNGSDFPYVHRDGGRLIEAKAIVFECGPNCGCGSHCVNRTAQRGLKYRFEVFRTPKKGWAVRSWDFIPSGAPICEYVGVLRRTEDLDNVSENNYIFEIDCLQTMKGIGGRERRLGDVSVPTISNTERLDDQKSESVPEFCIDAGSYGNIARFINHSCEPNLFVQCVLSSHQDLKLARVMLFAADNIPPLQELTYDYGYALDSVSGPDGKIIQMACYCGAAGCRKRLF
ncbi:histone-lysine N-methyltransferase, H3 lysine-9 specific SUVH4 isoform X1 [Ricinus communis]|uniref:histone-lysine N-methyltransferase, H3 lysine-9 specific SUVH4 isoform X1 n=2 Tax=Ricinus communis TaxID=3988 RepID=UPI00201A5209|nr:histone-lysine N-methyltransferase, H3 lysine-9 specific SUVH4 isoform X1 [Ricinus communis]